MDPVQVSANASYLRLKGTARDPEDDPVELVGIKGSVGLLRGRILVESEKPILQVLNMK